MKKRILLFLAILFGFAFAAPAQTVIYGWTNRCVLTSTNGAFYVQGSLLWTTNAVALPSNSIPSTTNTTWGYGPGLLTWGVDGGTNYLYQSITTNRWGRVALSTNW